MSALEELTAPAPPALIDQSLAGFGMPRPKRTVGAALGPEESEGCEKLPSPPLTYGVFGKKYGDLREERPGLNEIAPSKENP